MVDLLVKYLSFNKQASLKGIGTFSVEQLPARLDFPNRLLHAPQMVLHFSTSAKQDELFDQWLSDELHISEDEVKNKQQILVTDFQNTLGSNKPVEWNGIGKFTKEENQLLHFSSAFESAIGEPVQAEKIIRKNTAHFVRVGEDEKTNTEMEQLLFGKRKRKFTAWWIFALALFLLSFTAVWIFTMNNSRQWGTQGNGEKIKTDEVPSLYKIQ